mgnify:CR=1 FL=1
MMAPPPVFTMLRAASCEQRNTPRRLTAITLSQSSSAMSRKGLLLSMPALFTRMSIAPNSRSIPANIVSISRSLLTSAYIATAWPPVDLMSATILSAASRWDR